MQISHLKIRQVENANATPGRDETCVCKNIQSQVDIITSDVIKVQNQLIAIQQTEEIFSQFIAPRHIKDLRQ